MNAAQAIKAAKAMIVENAVLIVETLRKPDSASESIVKDIEEVAIPNFGMMNDSARYRLLMYYWQHSENGKMTVAQVAKVLEGVVS